MLFKEEYLNWTKENQKLLVRIRHELNNDNCTHQQTGHLMSTTFPSCVAMPTSDISQHCSDLLAPYHPLDYVMGASTGCSRLRSENNSHSSFFNGESPCLSKFYFNLAEQFFDSSIVLLLLLYIMM